jgi:hypothetical protein
VLEAIVIVVLLAASIGVAVRARFSWWSLAISIGVLEVLGFVLLGLPGAAFLEVIAPVMQRMGRPPITGDAAWPAAIMMSLAWPVALAPAYATARSVPLGNGQRGLVALAVLAALSFLIGMLCYGMLGSP